MLSFARNRIILLPLMVISLGSCQALIDAGAGQGGALPTAAEIEQYNASVPADQRIVCRREKPTGSRIAQVFCNRAGQIADQTELTQEEFMRVIR